MLNKSVLAAGTHDPLLTARLGGERRQIKRLAAGLARRLFVLPWLVRAPVGLGELSALTRNDDTPPDRSGGNPSPVRDDAGGSIHATTGILHGS